MLDKMNMKNDILKFIFLSVIIGICTGAGMVIYALEVIKGSWINPGIFLFFVAAIIGTIVDRKYRKLN